MIGEQIMLQCTWLTMLNWFQAVFVIWFEDHLLLYAFLFLSYSLQLSAILVMLPPWCFTETGLRDANGNVVPL